ncbi:MAG: type II toxin-antitoxin system PemK/MazF family toxin [Candidatus Micrarchaeota archaeon]
MKKGEIWLVNLPEGVGHEQKGTRPVLISACANGLTLAIPLTTNAETADLAYTDKIAPTKDNGLTESSVALVFQMRALDDSRFIRQLGWIPKEQRDVVDGLLKTLLKID